MESTVARIFVMLIVSTISLKDMAETLHITKVNVPSPMSTGEGGWLECEWADDGDTIYALKWYLGLDEFYRWTPAENPPVKTFQVRGHPISVDLDASRKGLVRFHYVTLEAAGVYRCEVSAEAPSFHTESAVAYMTVVDFPDSKPLITGVQPSYQTLDEVLLNCSSPLSQPPAKLTFYVNDEQADPMWLVHHKTLEDAATGLETAVLGLRFTLYPRLLRRGVVSVKCTAEIPHMYWDSSEAYIEGDVPYHASIMEGRASGGIDCMAVSKPLLLLAVSAYWFSRLLSL